MLVSEQEISEIKNFVSQINCQKESVVIVEGKRDTAALRKIGVSRQILEFHKFAGMIDFTDSVAKHEDIILLFDGDKKRKYLAGKIILLLERRTSIDLTFKKKLTSITKGKIRFIEQLVCYESYII